MFRCDTARISSASGTLFLTLGWNERSEGEWCDQDGHAMNFDYVREKVVASGATLRELTASARDYKKIQAMTWSDYFREVLGAGNAVVKALKAQGM